MTLKRVCLFLLFMCFAACSSPFDASESDPVSLSVLGKSLRIKNGTSGKIYYFAVESEHAAHINWAPLFTGPTIQNGKAVKISFAEIANGNPESARKGDRVIVYWWDDAHQSHEDIRAVAISL